MRPANGNPALFGGAQRTSQLVRAQDERGHGDAYRDLRSAEAEEAHGRCGGTSSAAHTSRGCRRAEGCVREGVLPAEMFRAAQPESVQWQRIFSHCLVQYIGVERQTRVRAVLYWIRRFCTKETLRLKYYMPNAGVFTLQVVRKLFDWSIITTKTDRSRQRLPIPSVLT